MRSRDPFNKYHSMSQRMHRRMVRRACREANEPLASECRERPEIDMSDENSSKPGMIYDLIPKIMKDVGAIGKDRDNPQQRYKFRGIDDIYNACQPVMSKYGVISMPTKVIAREQVDRQSRGGGTLVYTTLTMQFTFYAPDGSFVTAETVGEAMDSGDKSSNKAMSAAHKYAIIQTFSIPTDEPIDTENETHEVKAGSKSTAQRQSAPRERIDKSTGEVKPSGDPNGDVKIDDNFRAAIFAELHARSFNAKQSKAAIDQFIADNNLKKPSDAKVYQRTAFIAAIKAGKFDQHLDANQSKAA
jgi:hypothetical protein